MRGKRNEIIQASEVVESSDEIKVIVLASNGARI